MLGWLVGGSARGRLLVLSVAVGIGVLAVVQLRDVRIDVLPEFSAPVVEVQTEALGLAADEVEQLITSPMEADLLNGVAFLDQIHSESVPGLSSIQLVFEPGTDLLRARQLVQERLVRAHALPKVSKPPVMLQPLSSTSRAMVIGLDAAGLSLAELSVLARWKIKPRLMGVPGVANVAVWGQREQQLQVQVDPERLRRHGITLGQVVQTTGNALWVSPLSFLEASTPGTGGFLETPNQRLGVQHVQPIRTPRDLAQVTVEDTEGRVLRLGDVAGVVQDHQPLIGDGLVSEAPGLVLVVERFPDASVVDVTRGLDEALSALRPGLAGVTVDTDLYRPASFLEHATGDLRRSLALSVALVGLLLLAAMSLPGLAALASAVLSVLGAALALHLLGHGFNTMVLAGLVLGLVVALDDSVVDAAAVRRDRRADDVPRARDSAAAAVAAVLRPPRAAALAASTVVVAVLCPLLLLRGVDGALVRPALLAYVLTVVLSLLVSLTVTPALSTLLPVRHRVRALPWARAVRRGYACLLDRALARPAWPAAAGAVAVAAALAVLPQTTAAPVLPTFQDRHLVVQWASAPGTSRAAMSRITSTVVSELRALPAVGSVGAHIGRAVASDRVVAVSSGELWVSLRPDADHATAVRAVEDVVFGYPGMSGRVTTYPQEQIREAHVAGNHPLVVRVFGQDAGVLRREAERVRQALSDVSGVVDPTVRHQEEEPVVQVEVDLAKAQQHGVNPGDVRRAAATLVNGLDVGSLFEEQKVFDVVVTGTEATKHSLQSVADLLVDTPAGGHVRLGEVAQLRVAPNPSVIRHDAVSRLLDVGADVRGRDVDAVAREVRRALSRMAFPLEYHAELLSGPATQQGDRTRVLWAAAAAAAAVLVLLHAVLGAWRPALLVLLTLPLAASGALLAAAADPRATGLTTLLGLVGVLGLAARQGVGLLRHCQDLDVQGDASGPALLLRGAMDRAVPVVTSTAAAAVALLPLALLGDLPGHEVLGPLSAVLAGGLATTLALSLFVLPALCGPVGVGRRSDPLSEQTHSA